MRLIVISAAALALACSSVEDRAACATSASCPSGQYCARTSDGSVCWADAVRPAVSLVTASCAMTPCVRDGVLRVEATVTEDKELATVEAVLDLDSGARKIAMTAAGGRWVAELPLRDWPFEAYARPVVVSVVARDGARNEGSAEAVPVEVTRLRWVYDAGVPMSPAAVMDDGTIVVAGSTITDQLLAIGSSGESRWSVTIGSAFITATPSIADSAIWAASSDGRLYATSHDGVRNGNAPCATGEALHGGVAQVRDTTGKVVAGSQAAVLALADLSGFCNLPAISGPARMSPVVLRSGLIIAAGGSLLEAFSLQPNGSVRPTWSSTQIPNVGDSVTAPLAVDSEDATWSVATDGSVHRTALDGSTLRVATLGSSATGAVVLAGDDVVVGDQSNVLHRINATRPPLWTASAVLNGIPSAPLVVSGPSTHLIVPTSTGRLYAIRESDGSIAWSVKLSAAGAALQPANIYTPPGQPAGAVMSTAYAAGADGKLYAVIVDGELDTAAPWPKAFHDPRNTNNAGTQP
ncbi:PQQ-binding-like beta-propeller repeat protein [Anaeromyxobacter sp. SG64]|uniref:outer membrane protein assembly factor BamB family protein n=1 Tax=Anaeromyxobacter sp. SG64 TaxID=2925409 RepID=UPI001F58274F|nr:PQQ-binding-like beta-propeller repeat protein [Anaeromyxobacter sp. SG64]